MEGMPGPRPSEEEKNEEKKDKPQEGGSAGAENSPGTPDRGEQILQPATPEDMEHLSIYEEKEKLKNAENTSEGKTSELEKAQEKLVTLYLTKVEEGNLLRHELHGLVDVLIPKYKKEITLENMDDLSEKITEAEKRVMEIRGKMDATELSIGEIYGQVSDENIPKLKTVAMTERTQKELTPEEEAEAGSKLEDFMARGEKKSDNWEARSQEALQLLADFEAKHDLELLNSFTEAAPEVLKCFSDTGRLPENRMPAAEFEALFTSLSPESQQLFTVRQSAKNDHRAVFDFIAKMKGDTPAQQAELAELKVKLKILNRAIGVLVGGKIDHTR